LFDRRLGHFSFPSPVTVPSRAGPSALPRFRTSARAPS
jgi:hypothetical protein